MPLFSRISLRHRSVIAAPVALLVAGAPYAFVQKAQAQGYSFTSIADTNTVPPGGGTFPNATTTFSQPGIAPGGAVAFRATGAGAASVDAFYAYSNGALTRIVARGDAVSNVAGATINALATGTPVYDDAGRLSFTTTLSPTNGTTDRAVVQVSDNGATINAIAVRGQAAAGGGGNYGIFGNFGGNSAGAVVFTNNGTPWGVYKSVGGGAPTRIAFGGDTAPGGGAGETFNTFAFPTINAAGTTAFFATVVGGPSGQALFAADSGGNIARLVQTGDLAPGLGGATFTQLTQPALSDTGALSFRGTATDAANRQGIFLRLGASVTTLALQGAAAPGGGVFGNSFTNGRINGSNTGVFLAAGTGAVNGVFTFAGADATTVRRVLAVGDSALGSVVTSVGTPAISSDGSVAFEYSLQDGRRGILLASVAVPEPGTLGLLASVGLISIAPLALRRRRRRQS